LGADKSELATWDASCGCNASSFFVPKGGVAQAKQCDEGTCITFRHPSDFIEVATGKVASFHCPQNAAGAAYMELGLLCDWRQQPRTFLTGAGGSFTDTFPVDQHFPGATSEPVFLALQCVA
jgi:hypothetical protein